MNRKSTMKRAPELASILLCLAFSGCTARPDALPLSQRLVDVFDPAMVSGTPPAAELPAPTEWSFAGAEDPLGWEAAQEVAEVALHDGHLTAKTTGTMPILHVSVPDAAESGGDVLHEIRVRMAASAGTRMSMHFVGARPGPMDSLAARRAFWNATTPILGDGEMRSYTLTSALPVVASGVHEVYLQPSDAAGAEIDIESVRLVYRREYLAEASSGVGWLGLDGEYRETVAARAPETILWPVALPDRPRLELGLGLLDEHPLTFRVALETLTGEKVLAERRLTEPGRWEDVVLDLDEHAGHLVILSLSLEGDEGTPGLWGAPAVRRRTDPAAAWDDVAQGVVLIAADTLRPDHLGFYGHDRPTAPNLGRLANRGTVFLDANSHAPWTPVSMPSLLTSLYPSVHHVHGRGQRLPSSAVTLAEAYRAAGWTTAGFSAVPHTGRAANLHQGYESLQEASISGTDKYFAKTARDFVDRLLPWLERHRDERFFVFFHVFDPHAPYEPRPPFHTLWAEESRHAQYYSDLRRVQAAITSTPLKAMQGHARREELERSGVDRDEYLAMSRDWYDSSIRAMDEHLGRLFDRMDELGLGESVLLAFTSDHGEEFLDHGWMGHSHSLYSELIHVPLVLEHPKLVPAGAKVGEPVQHLDVMPTLLELSGVSVPESAMGESLVPLLRHSKGYRPRPIVAERPAKEPLGYASTSLLYDGWKLIRHGEGRGDLAEYELYDHRDDPGDTHDLAAERPEVVERLASLLDDWRRDVEAHQLPSDADLGTSLSQEELERLRSLGYVQ